MARRNRRYDHHISNEDQAMTPEQAEKALTLGLIKGMVHEQRQQAQAIELIIKILQTLSVPPASKSQKAKNVMNPIFTWLQARLTEPSTWVGVGTLGTAITHKDWTAAFQAVMGILGIVLPEKGSAPVKK